MSFVEGLFATDEELEEKYMRRVDLFEWLEATGIPNTTAEYYRCTDDIPHDVVHHSEFTIRMMDPIDSVEAYDHNMAGVALMSRTISSLGAIPRGYTIERISWAAVNDRRAYVVTVYK